MSGLKLAALYGFYPQRKGYCGPLEKSATQSLLRYISGSKESEEKIRNILKEFKGAFSYYKLISESNKIKDPFDDKVVEAYWIGNELLEKVPVESLKKMILEDFTGSGFLSIEEAEERIKKISQASKPHHSFHVLVLGAVSGRVELEGDMKDLCRISWGRVEEKKEEEMIISFLPLVFNERYKLGEKIEKETNWDEKIIPHLKIGDWVSVHWNYPIQILNKERVYALKKYTQETLDSLSLGEN